MLKAEQIKFIERRYRVFVAIDSMQYNSYGENYIYGWKPIPHEWVSQALKYKPKRCGYCGGAIGSNDEGLCDECFKLGR